VDYGSSKVENKLNAQLAKVEKKFAELVKSSNQLQSETGKWETGNPHTTAWGCGCGFQNFKSRAVCMKCKTPKQEASSGLVAAAAGGQPAGATVEATGGPAAPLASKPDEELAFWRSQHRFLGTTAAGPGKVRLMAQAEGMIADLTKEVRACKPLAARFQAAEAKLQAAKKSFGAAQDAVKGLEQQLQLACETLGKEGAAVQEAEADVLATRTELAAPAAAPAVMDTLGVVQQVLNQLLSLGVVQVQSGSDANLQLALGRVLEGVLTPAPAQHTARVEKVPEGDFDPHAMNVCGTMEAAGDQLALVSAGPSSSAPGAAALALAAAALESAKAVVEKGAARTILAGGNYGAQRGKSDLRADPIGRPTALSPPVTPASA
jgi:hypothetical protein